MPRHRHGVAERDILQAGLRHKSAPERVRAKIPFKAGELRAPSDDQRDGASAESDSAIASQKPGAASDCSIGKIPGRYCNYREILPGVIAAKSSGPR